MTLLVGTSGWQYRDWRGVLYPQGVPQRLWLEQYAQSFATVELNNAFYRLPSAETFASWRARTPPGFRIAVKASRFLTHIKRLRDPEEPVARLMGRAASLGERLGPILLQLPPTLRADPALLEQCLRCFPAGTRVAVEPRHESWWTEETKQVLERRGAALCWADAGEQPVTPLWRTTDWGYLRLHHGTADPWPRYHPDTLTEWARRLTRTWPQSGEVEVYFNNDPGGAAIYDAAAFARSAGTLGAEVTRTPDISPTTAPPAVGGA
ncbi:DUF72 domain-containing protein [Nocardia cyriacigeorgica]|uniref:DUF72 domain-containing protein n=1 Tax=Nocardia cyriacigeorgica TaxID=135487 RepID=UPI0018962B93|nr:DUF72 domain-containing protein [Nocardia cyriacigeorgica]MBF6413980.1 DUF72 domain-containing protein [Nocardia cyriacigeorgica]